MHEVIKKSIDNFRVWFTETSTITTGEIKDFIITSHITLAEEKIKELEREKRDTSDGFGAEASDFGYNAHIEEEIDKWKQFISELKQ